MSETPGGSRRVAYVLPVYDEVGGIDQFHAELVA